jgi:hypothetical protein
MIYFFKMKRWLSMKDQKYFKYTKYVIGEIFIVIVGILVAIQLNNWNQKRLERIEEVKILKSIKNDLENTVHELQFLNEIRRIMLMATREIYEMAESKVINEKDLDSLIVLTFYTPTFNNKLGVIDLLFSSGKNNLIKNDSIKQFLIGWSGLIEDMTEEEDYGSLVFHNHYYPRVAKYLYLKDLDNESPGKSFISTEIPNRESYPELPFESDYEGLLRDKTFLNYLKHRANYTHTNRIESKSLIFKAEKMIKSIDSEINR